MTASVHCAQFTVTLLNCSLLNMIMLMDIYTGNTYPFSESPAIFPLVTKVSLNKMAIGQG